MLRWFFYCLILINSSENGLFVAGFNGYEMIPACKVPNVPQSNDVHYVTIIHHAVGTYYASAHNYLFQQLYCGLNDARKDNTGVKFYSWHIDTELGKCIVFETNLLGAFDDLYVIPPSQTGTSLCKKLEIPKKCASSIPHDQKVEIAIPLLLHETLGKCDMENVFGFANQKTIIFWTCDYYQPRNLPSFSSNDQFVMFGAAQDFLPQEKWLPNQEMVNAVKNGKSDMVKALHLRFQQMIGINKKNIGESFKRKRPTTTTFAPSKHTTAKILNAGFNILPFFQPKPVKVQQSTTIPAQLEIHEKFDQSFIADTMCLVVPGKSKDRGKRFDRNRPSQSQKDNSSEVATNGTSTAESGKFLLTTLPTKAAEEYGFFESFGEFIGDREYGAFYFFCIILAVVADLLLLLFLMWCCCIRESTKGKYEVMKKENPPIPAEPDLEAGVAYPGESIESFEQPLLKASVLRVSIKAETEKLMKAKYYDDSFGIPQQSTPASPPGHPTSPVAIFPQLYSPAPLTLHSQTSQIADIMRLVKPSKSKDLGKRLDRKHPSQPQKDNASDITTNGTSTAESDKFLLHTTLPPKEATEAKEDNGFFESFGESFGNREYGAFYFFCIILAVVADLLLLLFLMWCCCIRESTKGKYEVMKKENQLLPAEPDLEAGVAYPGGSFESSEQPLLKASVLRVSIKAETEWQVFFACY